jgi:hypothetical protein
MQLAFSPIVAEEGPNVPRMGIKDYLALAIAALETVLLPLLILIVLLLVLTFYFAGRL